MHNKLCFIFKMSGQQGCLSLKCLVKLHLNNFTSSPVVSRKFYGEEQMKIHFTVASVSKWSLWWANLTIKTEDQLSLLGPKKCPRPEGGGPLFQCLYIQITHLYNYVTGWIKTNGQVLKGCSKFVTLFWASLLRCVKIESCRELVYSVR